MVAIVDHPHRPLTAAREPTRQPQGAILRCLNAIETRGIGARGHHRANHFASTIHPQQRVAVAIAHDETILRRDHATRINRRVCKRHEGGIAVTTHLDAVLPEQQQRAVGIHRSRAKRPGGSPWSRARRVAHECLQCRIGPRHGTVIEHHARATITPHQIACSRTAKRRLRAHLRQRHARIQPRHERIEVDGAVAISGDQPPLQPITEPIQHPYRAANGLHQHGHRRTKLTRTLTRSPEGVHMRRRVVARVPKHHAAALGFPCRHDVAANRTVGTKVTGHALLARHGRHRLQLLVDGTRPKHLHPALERLRDGNTAAIRLDGDGGWIVHAPLAFPRSHRMQPKHVAHRAVPGKPRHAVIQPVGHQWAILIERHAGWRDELAGEEAPLTEGARAAIAIHAHHARVARVGDPHHTVGCHGHRLGNAEPTDLPACAVDHRSLRVGAHDDAIAQRVHRHRPRAWKPIRTRARHHGAGTLAIEAKQALAPRRHQQRTIPVEAHRHRLQQARHGEVVHIRLLRPRARCDRQWNHQQQEQGVPHHAQTVVA